MSYLPENLDSPIMRAGNYPMDGGYENNVNSHLLAPNRVAKLLNVRPVLEGYRQKRFGAIPHSNDSNLVQLGGPPQGLGYVETRSYGAGAPNSTDSRLLVAMWNKKLYKTFDEGASWGNFANNATFVDTYYQFAVGRCSAYTGFNFTTIGVGGSVDILACCPYVSQTAATSLYGNVILTNFDGTGHWTTSYTNCRAVVAFQGRLWFAQDRRLFWTAFNEIRATGNSFEDVTQDDGPITALMPTREATPRMAVFRLNAVYLLDIYWNTDGYYPSNSGTNNLDFTKAQYRPLVGDVGCVGARAVTWVPGFENGDFLFMSREGIRSLRRSITDAQGGVNLPLSWRIQPDIDRINWARAETINSTTLDGVAYFAVPMDGAANPNQIIAYDIHRDAFYTVDWQVTAWARVTSRGSRKIFFQGSSITTEYSGPAVQGYHIYEAFSGTSDPGGTSITYEEYTRGFSFGSQEDAVGLTYKKDWTVLDTQLQGDASSPATMSVYYKVDDAAAWTQFLTIPIPSGAVPLRRRFSLHTIPPGYKLDLRFLESSICRPRMYDLNVEAIRLSCNPLN